MITKTTNNLTYFQFHNLSKELAIQHYTTSRLGGFSRDHLAELNMGYTVNDNPDLVDKNHKLLSEATGIHYTKFVFPKQTNGTNVAIVNSADDIFPDTDSLITNKKDIHIGIKTADCVPILLFDPEKKVIAAIHSGWNGTVKKISKKTIELMIEEFQVDPENLIAGIGPSIGPAVYEIGPDVIDLVKNSFPTNRVLNYLDNSDKALFDLWEANKIVLIDCGVLAKNIEIAEMCTYSNPELFYSARRNGTKTGRLATGIIMQ